MFCVVCALGILDNELSASVLFFVTTMLTISSDFLMQKFMWSLLNYLVWRVLSEVEDLL